MKLQLPRGAQGLRSRGVGSPLVSSASTPKTQQKLQPEPLVCALFPMRLPMLRCVQVGVDGPLRAVATGRLMALVDWAPQRRRGPDIWAEAIRARVSRGGWEAEFGETSMCGHLCARCRHRRGGSNCMGPLLRKLKMTRRGRGDEERTSIVVARCFVLGLARAVLGVVTAHRAREKDATR